MSLDTVPKDLRGLRACLVCSLIKTFDQFEYDGCDNCDEFLRMKNNKDNVYDCTSNNFDGMIAVMSPEDSWVCKWQRIIYYLNTPLSPVFKSQSNPELFRSSASIIYVKSGIFGARVVTSPEKRFRCCEYALITDHWNIYYTFADRFCKGVYAISVSGRLPAGVIREMKSRGFVYRPRDTSQR